MSASRIEVGREVVITGIGLVTPLGWGQAESWEGLLAGRSAAVWLDELNGPPGKGPHCAGMPVPGVLLCEPLRLRKFATFAADEALRDSRLEIGSDVDPVRVGCVVGVSKSDFTSYSQWVRRSSDTGDDADAGRVVIQAALCPNDPAMQLARRFGIQGAALCPMAACATGLLSIIRGVQLIQDGVCDAVVAGSVDASLSPALLACYGRLKVLASGFDDPRRAIRPFEVHRNGFLVGEGAGMLVLESAELSRSRGRPPFARVLGYAMGNDPTGMTDINTNGETLARVIRDALRRSNLAPTDIDAVQVHGTATWQNDLCESRAIHTVWGTRRPPPVSSVKGSIGHLLGGAGSVEAAIAVLSLRDQVLPPAIGFAEVDPECGVDVSPHVRPMELRRVLKLSLGFGGHLAAVVLECCDHATSERNRVVEEPDPQS